MRKLQKEHSLKLCQNTAIQPDGTRLVKPNPRLLAADLKIHDIPPIAVKNNPRIYLNSRVVFLK